jgi:O-antigen/teichoic acid export membrane protein
LVAEQAVAALGEFRARLIIQWAVAGLSVVMNLLVIPVFGWQGAAWILVASEVVLALSFVLIIYMSVPGIQEQPS